MMCTSQRVCLRCQHTSPTPTYRDYSLMFLEHLYNQRMPMSVHPDKVSTITCRAFQQP